MNQTTIRWDELIPYAKRMTVQERFEIFDENHPEVWRLFVKFAQQVRAAGRGKYSARASIHRIRGHYAVNPERDEGFKINDVFSARYARKLIDHDATFAELFELRELRRE